MPSLRRSALLAWLLVTLLVSVAWSVASVRGVQAQFETNLRILHRVLSQRAEQQAAVLASLTALTRANVSDEALGRYIEAMRAQYPQIAGVQHCRATCTTINSTGTFLPRQPLPPDHTGLRWHPGRSALYAITEGDVRVWVNARQLYQTGDYTDETSSFRVLRPTDQVTLIEQPLKYRQGVLDRMLPVLRVQKVLGSSEQPLLLEGTHPLRWAELPLSSMLLFAVIAAAATMLPVRLIEGRECARAAAQEAEQALQTERARAERAFHAVSEALVVTDAQHRVRLINAAARTLLGEALTPGRDVREVVRFRATLDQQHFDPEGFWGCSSSRELPEGVTLITGMQARLVEGALSPVESGADGRPAGWVLVLRDVGPLRARVTAALEAGERRVREHAEMLTHASRLSTLGEMSAGLAHELNQPLTAIVSHGQATLRLLDDAEVTSHARRSVEAIVAQGKRAAGIIAHMRGLVKRGPTREEQVDVSQVVENALTLARPGLEAAGVTVRSDLHPTSLLVVVDPVHLEQVLLNLLRNAGEAARGQPAASVAVHSGLHDGQAVIRVLDTGSGLSEEVLAKLFSPFTTTKPEGLGLGLSLSQSLVHAMDGSLTGENQPSGGAVFTVTLPLTRRVEVAGA